MRKLFFHFIILWLLDSFLAQDTAGTKYADPEKMGYRYCANWKLADGTNLHSTCDPFAFKRCGKTLEFGYDCCSGFKKIGPPIFDQNSFGNQVCAQTIPQWKSCPEVLSLFSEVAPFSNMIKGGVMTNENPTRDFTIFAPQSKNGNDLSKIYSSNGQGSNNPIYYHVVKGRFYASKLRNNQELESVYQDQKLKVTKYSFGVVCIECVEITKADIECKNGVIHFLRKPLVPKTGTSFSRNNVFEAIKSDPETSSFANDIPLDLQNELKNIRSKAWFTILAVKNDDWNAVKNKYSGKDLEAIVRHHILNKLYCSAALSKDSRKLLTSSGESIHVECSTEGNTEVRSATDPYGGKSKFISHDHMAGNGVYHTLDKAVIPMKVRTLQDILKDTKLGSSLQTNKYFDYIKDCDLRMEPGKKYAVILPMDVSFDWWKQYSQFQPEYNKFISDPEYRCRVARYHIVPFNDELKKVASLPHEQKGLKTNNKDLLHEVNYFKKDKDGTDVYFHYSQVSGLKSTEFRDGSIYRTSKINVIPEKFIVDILKENPKLQITSKQVQSTDIDPTEFKKRRPLSLFLATLDEGLTDPKTGKTTAKIAALHDKALKDFLLLHTVPLYLWGGDIGYFKKNTVHKFMSRTGIELTFWMDDKNTMRIGYEGLPKDQWAEVVQFNLHAKDGIVWLLKRNLPCPKKICEHKVVIVDRDLFDVYVSACQFLELPGIKDAKDAKKQYNARPIQIAFDNPDKCAIFKQPTHSVEKKLKP